MRPASKAFLQFNSFYIHWVCNHLSVGRIGYESLTCSSSASSLHLCWTTHGFRSLPNRFMYKVLLIFVCCIWLSCRHHSAHSTSERAATTCACSAPVVAIQERLCAFGAHPGDLAIHSQDLVFASLQGQSFAQDHQIPHWILQLQDGSSSAQPVEVPSLQTTLQGDSSTLPKLRKTMEQVLRQELHPSQGGGQLVELDEFYKRDISQTAIQTTKKLLSESPRSKREGKRQKAKQRRAIGPYWIYVAFSACSPLDARNWHWGVDGFGFRCNFDGLRALGCHQEKFPRRLPDAERDQGYGGEISGIGQSTNHSRTTSRNHTIGEGQEVFGRADRISWESPPSVDEISQRVHRIPGPPTREIQRTGKTIHRIDGQSQKRDQECTRNYTNPQCKCRDTADRSSSSTLPRSGCRGVERIATAGRDPDAEKFSSTEGHQGGEGGDGRSFHGRGRRVRAATVKTSQISGSSYPSFFIRSGSVLSCLRRSVRQPLHVTFQVVEAYEAWDLRAACHFKGKDATDCRIHSVMWEDDYVDPWKASTRAMQLAGSLVLESMMQDKVKFFCMLNDICHQRRRQCPISRFDPHDCSSAVPFSHHRLLDERSNEVEAASSFLPAETTDDEHDHPFDRLDIVDGGDEIRLYLDTLMVTEDTDVRLVTYGLYQDHIGTRQTSSPPDWENIKVRVFQLWEDILTPGTWQGDAVAAYHTPGLNPSQMLVQCGLTEWCVRPGLRTTCHIHVEKRVLPPLSLVPLRSGSLLEAFIHFGDIEEEHQSEGASGTDLDYPHVRDRWCDSTGLVLADPSSFDAEPDHVDLMQRPTGTTEARVMHHFFHMRTQYIYGLAHPTTTFNDVITDLWELPSYGPQAIRQLHAVSFPPDFVPHSDYVFILELNEDETRRLYDDEVLCLVQIRFDTNPPSNDRRDSFRVIWSPPTAT